MRGGRMRRSMSEINVVPYIDVMLVLLVIFMVAAPLIAPGNIDLPSVERSSQAKMSPIEIIIKADKTVSLRASDSRNPAANIAERVVTPAQMLALIRQRQADNTEQPVVIFADKTVQYDSVMQIMDTLQKNDVRRVGLAVQPAASPAGR